MSASFALSALTGAVGVTSMVVAGLILRTRHHEPTDALQIRLNDLDLAILSSSPKEYDHYAAQIRQEYAHVPDGQYRTARAGFMRKFLERDRIYHLPTSGGQEVAARANIAREIAQLEQRP